MSYFQGSDVQSAEQKRNMEQILIPAKTTVQTPWLLGRGRNKHTGVLWVSLQPTEVEPTRWN